MIRRRVHLNAVQTLTIGFACLILAGAVLLMLPISSRSGQSIPFLDALFTSASASCVTGLVLYDTWTQFTIFRSGGAAGADPGGRSGLYDRFPFWWPFCCTGVWAFISALC